MQKHSCDVYNRRASHALLYSTTVYSRIEGHGWRNVYYCRIPNAVLIRECIRIVKKQCITSDNKQIGAGRGKEKLCIIRGFKLGGIKEGSFSGTTLYYFLFSRYFPDTPPRLNFLSFFSRRNKIIFSTILDRNVILSKRVFCHLNFCKSLSRSYEFKSTCAA